MDFQNHSTIRSIDAPIHEPHIVLGTPSEVVTRHTDRAGGRGQLQFREETEFSSFFRRQGLGKVISLGDICRPSKTTRQEKPVTPAKFVHGRAIQFIFQLLGS